MKKYFNKLLMPIMLIWLMSLGVTAGIQQYHQTFTPEHAVASNAKSIPVPSFNLITTANAAAMSDSWENSIIDYLFRAQTYTAPTTIYIALETAAGSDTGCGTEVSGGSYARVAVTSSLANWAGTQSAGSTTASSGTSGTTSNNAAITYAAPTANWGSVTGFCGMTASTGGSMLFRANLTATKTINNGDAAPSFAIGAATFQIDN